MSSYVMGSYDHDDDLDYYQDDNSGMMICIACYQLFNCDYYGGYDDKYEDVFPYCDIGETIYWTEQLL